MFWLKKKNPIDTLSWRIFACYCGVLSFFFLQQELLNSAGKTKQKQPKDKKHFMQLGSFEHVLRRCPLSLSRHK